MLLLALACTANAENITGRVVGVADGDTITVLDADKVQHKIRLAGIGRTGFLVTEFSAVPAYNPKPEPLFGDLWPPNAKYFDLYSGTTIESTMFCIPQNAQSPPRWA